KPELAARAATVVGFVEAVAGIDTSVPLAQRRWNVHEHQKRFEVLTNIGQRAKGLWNERFAKDVTFVTDQFFGDHDWTRPEPKDQAGILKNVLARIRTTRAESKVPGVVVDLDDTVLNPAVRTLKIVKEYAATRQKELSALDLAVIETLQPEQLGYSATANLEDRWALSNQTFLGGSLDYWKTKFFSNEYVVEDGVYPGAAAYVQAMKDAGAVVVYLTGRHEKGTKPGTERGMRDGTTASLRRHNFPLPDGHAVQLIMKPDFDLKDLDYKLGFLPTVAALGVPVAVFDNEPKIDNMFVAQWPDATVVRIGRCRSPNPELIAKQDGTQRAPLLQDIPRVDPKVLWIQDFRMANGRLAQE
ncbi:MAG: hypothetical protein Q7R41_11890, partial [Phycisphaerales bacterium]|nr:hypothetical protein [Phycisphaerales bacterium]